MNRKQKSTKNDKLKEKVLACLLLSSYLDTIGFKNGEFEFKSGKRPKNVLTAGSVTYEMIYHFFILGGPNHISIKNLSSSDDTILLLATTEALINGGGEINYIDRYLKWFPILSEDFRLSGYITIQSLYILNNNFKKKMKSYQQLITYDENMGGNGAAIRTATIGIKWYNDIDKIIEESLIASRVTHNYYIGFLGGIVAALFTSFAFNDIKPWLWIDKLLEIYENGKIHNQIHKTDLKNTIDDDIKKYFIYFYKYKEERLHYLLTFRAKDFILNPIKQMENLVTYNKKLKDDLDKDISSYILMGSSGLDSIILAYEAIILSIVPNPNYTIDLNEPIYSWESLLFFSCLHVGDTDSTGAIAGAWFGALNGFKNFDKNKLHDLEFYDLLQNVGYKLFKQLCDK